MKPYFTDEQATLYLGDALTALPHRGGRIMTHECPFSAEPADHLFAEGC